METCPYCNGDFEVSEYGHHVPCPLCGKKLKIFPDSDLWIETPWGIFGVGGEFVKTLEKIVEKLIK